MKQPIGMPDTIVPSNPLRVRQDVCHWDSIRATGSNADELRPEALLTLEQYMAAVLASCPPMPGSPGSGNEEDDPTVLDDLCPTQRIPMRFSTEQRPARLTGGTIPILGSNAA